MKTIQPVALAALLLVGCCVLLQAQPGPPEWMDQIDPTKYILLARDFKPPFAYGTDAVIEASGQGVHLDDGQGHVTEQTTFFMYAVQTVKSAEPYANTARTNPPTPMRWDMHWTMTVAIYQNEEVAKAAVRTHYLSLAGPFTAEDENCLNDPRLNNGRGAAGANGMFVRYRNLLLKIELGQIQEIKGNRQPIDAQLWYGANGDAENHQYQLVPALAKLWLDKVAGPDRPDLHVDGDSIRLRVWEPHLTAEREPVCDQQSVTIWVQNRSATVPATDVQVQLLVKKQGEEAFAPVAGPQNLARIAPGKWGFASFFWDLGGKNIENAILRAIVSRPGQEDMDPVDNQADLPVSICFAYNGTTGFRWVDDSYSFPNYGYDGREGQELIEGLLATVLRQLYSDAEASTLLTRLLFPQTFTRIMDYLTISAQAGAGGHCYGMSATCGLYFMDASLRPSGGRTCDLSRDAASANVNIYQRAQLVPLVQSVLSGDIAHTRVTSSLQCANTARTSFQTDRWPVLVEIFGTRDVEEQVEVNGQMQLRTVKKDWGHALLAYKLVETPGAMALYVYDPNLPPRGQWGTQQPSSAFAINPATGVWSLSPDMTPLYPGVEAISARPISRAISLAEVNAIIPVLKGKLAEMMSWFEKANKIMAVLHCPADVVFTDPQGRRTGVVSGRMVNQIPGAEVRSQGEVEIYVLPSNVPLSLQITGSGNGATGLDIIRSVGNGVPELTSFDSMPTSPGTVISGSIATGGKLDNLRDATGATYTPRLIGTLQGDRVSWQTGTAAPTMTPTPPTTTPTTPTRPDPGSQPNVGELIVCRSVTNGEASGIADSFPRLPTIACLLRYQALPAQTVVCVWKRDGTEVSRSQRDLPGGGGSGWVSFSLRTDDSAGLPAGLWEVTLTGAGGQVLGRRSFTMGQAAGAPPATGEQGGRTSGQQEETPGGEAQEYQLTSSSSSFAVGGGYPAAGGSVRLSYRWQQAGVILDTVGINAARPGDFSLRQLGDGTVTWQIYNPGVQGAHREPNGWHVLASSRKFEAKQWHRLTATWGPGGMKLIINGEEVASDPVVLTLSGNPVYIGDFPGDDGWGAAYNIHPAMVGKVKGIRFVPQ